MKKIVFSFVAAALFSAATLTAVAQPAPKILVVDMAKLLDSHYKTEEQNAKLKSDEQKAQDEIERLNKEGNALVEDYKASLEKAKLPALSDAAKSKAETEAQAKLEDIQKKQNQVQNFRAQTQRTFQQRIKTFRDLMLEEIGKIATDIAKRKNATLLLDKSGPSLIGISNIIYYDSAYDITDDVLKEINKTRPAGSVAAPAPTPTSSATSDDKPLFSMPK